MAWLLQGAHLNPVDFNRRCEPELGVSQDPSIPSLPASARVFCLWIFLRLKVGSVDFSVLSKYIRVAVSQADLTLESRRLRGSKAEFIADRSVALLVQSETNWIVGHGM